MKNTFKLIHCAILPALLVCGCADTGSSTVGGGLLGAGLGAVVGHMFHATGAGALIGAGTGAIVGNSIGHANEGKQARSEVAARQAALSLEDVAYMAQSHTSDVLIINQIRSTGALYNLSPEQITWLRQQGVSDAVISEMQATAYRYQPARVYAPEPVVGVGISYGRRW
jgi:hypothetical protein